MSSTLQPGARLGVYEILSSLGEGGMGAVYRARDTRLKRDVAIKVLLPEVANDPERLARFQREAEVLATLNHPNIAHIYDLESREGQEGREGQDGREGLLGPFLVLELVEGPTLADRIAATNGRGISLDEALPIAKQIAEALDAAHEHGIIHRDLKPANIKVKDDGTVKVLDFGLAKASERPGMPGGPGKPGVSGESGRTGLHALTQSPTITSPALMTGVGMLLGTAAYMSPEQAKGRPADKRADIWAFGCVLYEMLTGRRAFDGDDATEVIAAVVKTTPDWKVIPSDVPRAIVTLIQRCLEKDKHARIGDLSVARFVLADAASLSAPLSGDAPAVAAAPRSPWFIPAAVAALLATGGGASIGTWYLTRAPKASAPMEQFVITTPSDARPDSVGSAGASLAISPDGSRIVYRSGNGATSRLWMRDRSKLEPTKIAGAEGSLNAFFSPDGKWLAFIKEGTLSRMPVSGGAVERICVVDGTLRGASWGNDDQIVFATQNGGGLWRVRASGGVPEQFTEPDPAGSGTRQWWPEVLPDGQSVLVTAWGGTFDRSHIDVVSLKDGRVTKLIDGGTYGRYAPSGHILFARSGSLQAIRFDLQKLAVVGEVRSVLRDVGVTNYGAAQFAVGSDGAIVYGTGGSATGPRTLVWLGRDGREVPVDIPPHAYVYPRLSPDGTRVALDARDGQSDIWTFDLARGTLQRLTTDPSPDRGPVWTPDGARIAFTSGGEGADATYWQAADGATTAEQIHSGPRPRVPNSFTPDGKAMLFLTPTGGPFDIGMMELEGNRRERMLFESAASETNPEVSPDGHWLAYQTNESGRNEIYVSAFPDVTSTKTLVSVGGGTRPVWSRDGRELFYYFESGGTDGGRIMSVPVGPGPRFSPGKPRLAVDRVVAPSTNAGRHFDVSVDGKSFLIVKDAGTVDANGTSSQEIRIVLHFFDELNRQIPVGTAR